jgi:2-oxoglutarate ferredoxin oxidoreductase subunit delta
MTENIRILLFYADIYTTLTTDTMDDTNPVKERKIKGRVEIDIQKCKGCELCTIECKKQALTLSETINLKGYRYIIANNEVCNACMNCALVCPDAVITVYRTHPRKKRIGITPTDIKEQIQSMFNPAP